MRDTIKSAISSGHGNAILYAGTLGLLLSDIIPTPADSIYFAYQSKNKKKLENKQITPTQYWTRETIAYYGLNPLWWSLVLGMVYLTKGEYTKKISVGVGIISIGALIGVINKNIKKENYSGSLNSSK